MSRKLRSTVNKIPLEELKVLIKESTSYREVLEKLSQATSGSAFRSLKLRIHRESIDDSHIKQARFTHVAKDVKDFLVKGAITNSARLKARLIKHSILKEECSICGISNIWNGKILVLHLDHINGDHHDNSLENLRIVCPNCHSQTDTFGNKKREKEIKPPKPPKPPKEVKEQRPKLLKTRPRPEKRKVLRPSKEELEKLIGFLPWVKIGKMFGVSDNAIRKWAKTYGLLTSKRITNK